MDYCRGKCRAIAINRSYALAPWSDWFYGADAGWFWARHWGPERLPGWPDASALGGTAITLWSPALRPENAAKLPLMAAAGVKILKHAGEGEHEGVSSDPGTVRGNNSTHQVMSVLMHTGVSRVILLGVDMRELRHWHEGYPDQSHPDYEGQIVPKMRTLAEPYERAGVEVYNCSQDSAVDAFPMARLADVLH